MTRDFAVRKAKAESRRRAFVRAKRPTENDFKCQPWATKRDKAPQARCTVCGVVVPRTDDQQQGHVMRNHPGQEGWA